MPKAHDLKGKRFGRLMVIRESDQKSSRKRWECLCDCGRVSHVVAFSLVGGKTTSCGCRKIEAALENCKEHGLKPRHGMTNSRVWKIWSGMLDRTRPDAREFHVERYYSRGITVCERWRTFENFFEDMGPPPEGMSIDRIKVDRGYEPGNCRWATARQQQNNKVKTRFLIVDGEKRSLMDIANELGIKKSAAQYFYSTYRKLLSEFGSIKIGEG